MFKFSLMFFKTSLFPNLITDLIHLWYDDRYWSIILPSFILIPLVHVKVKVTVMSKFSVKILRQSFKASLHLNQTIDLIYIWCHDIYWSKVFISTIGIHDGELGVEITNSFKFLRPHYFLILSPI